MTDTPSLRLGRRGHGRTQVRHDDGTAKLGRGMGHNGGERIAVTQVQVPVVRASERDGLDRLGAWGVGHGDIVPKTHSTLFTYSTYSTYFSADCANR
jgi:hypothetical protein